MKIKKEDYKSSKTLKHQSKLLKTQFFLPPSPKKMQKISTKSKSNFQPTRMKTKQSNPNKTLKVEISMRQSLP
jgi:hypothetical protein